MIVSSKITSMDDCDFGSLFAASYDAMAGGTYVWPDKITDMVDRKEYIRNHFNSVCRRQDGLAYKASIDGIDVLVCAGIVTSPTSFEMLLTLTGPDMFGSKSWIHDAAFITDQRAFLETLGITSLSVMVIEGAVTDTHMLGRSEYDRTSEVRDMPTGKSFKVIKNF